VRSAVTEIGRQLKPKGWGSVSDLVVSTCYASIGVQALTKDPSMHVCTLSF
jgi:hypothetical protein